MNDLQILHDAWAEPDAPSNSSREQARTDLLARATMRSRRRWTVRVAAMGGLATALVAGIAMVPIRRRSSPSSLPVASAAVLEAAAVAAEDEPFTPPRDDQWIYTREKFSDVVPQFRQEKWRRADGGGFAFYDEAGRLEVEMLRPRRGRSKPVPLGPLAGYKQLAALPTDPKALLRWAYGQTANIEGGGSNEHAEVYGIFEGMISDNVLPPDLKAGIFRALKQVPGVTVNTVEVNGERVIALGQTDDWLHSELLLDAKSYDYVARAAP